MLTRNKKLKDYGIPAEDIENILHRKSYRKISRERYIPMNPKDFYGYRRKTVAVLYERMRLLGMWEDE